jgi:preprotein translocase subunit SecG
MASVLLVVQVVVGLALVGVILLQRSDSDGFGLGSGSGMNLLSGRQTANLLTRTTAILASLFMLNALALSIIAAHSHGDSIVETIQAQEVGGAPAVPVDTTGAAPVIDEQPKKAPQVPKAE